jgi:hypothetical protein
MTPAHKKQILQWYETIPYSCLKSAIRFYEQGNEVGAGQLLASEHDKLRTQPELVELLKAAFPTYKAQIES